MAKTPKNPPKPETRLISAGGGIGLEIQAPLIAPRGGFA
jgi:hypothetical protein